MASKTITPIVLRFKFDSFENLPSEPGDKERCQKDVTDDYGNVWSLRLFPGGRDVPNGSDATNIEGGYGDEKMIDLYLLNRSGGDVKSSLAFIVRNSAGGVYHYTKSIHVDVYGEAVSIGYKHILTRSEIIDKANGVLLDGALIVDVELQVQSASGLKFSPPPLPISKNMLTLFETEEASDVSFKVGDTLIPAHRLILRMNAPILFGFCEEHGGDLPVPIKDTTPEIFRLVLRYVYGAGFDEAIGMLDSDGDGEDDAAEIRTKMGMEIINASNQYGIVCLKQAVEIALVERCVVNMENVVDFILFADAKTCPLLKEYSMDYFAAMAKDILNSESSKQLKESPKLMSELLMISVSNNKPDAHFNKTNKMTVDQLRSELDAKGLDVDGSKETLVSLMERANKKQRVQ